MALTAGPTLIGPATLIVNPAAGRADLLPRQLPIMERLLAAHGHTMHLRQTTAEPGSAARLAREAAPGSGLVLACGGDGTVHDVVQGLAGVSAVRLGVLPLGTANALARNLGLPLEPLAALTRLLIYTPRSVPLGRVETAGGQRWFVTVAGCGPDGALVHALPPKLKARLGRSAYYAYAARLFLSRRWSRFTVRYRLPGQAGWAATEAVALLAARVPDLGGAFTGLARQVPLLAPTLSLRLLRPPAQLTLPAWFAAGALGLPNPWLLSVDVEEAVCDGPADVLGQADAEPLGGLPMRLSLVPDALTLLMPPPAVPTHTPSAPAR